MDGAGGIIRINDEWRDASVSLNEIIIKRKDADAPTEDGASQEYMIFRQVIE